MAGAAVLDAAAPSTVSPRITLTGTYAAETVRLIRAAISDQIREEETWDCEYLKETGDSRSMEFGDKWWKRNIYSPASASKHV